LKKRKKSRKKNVRKNIKGKKIKRKTKRIKGIVNSLSYIHCGEYDVMWGY